MKTRIRALLLAAVLVLTMTTGVLAAPASQKLTVEADHKAGTTVVSLTLSGAAGVTNGRLVVTYDPKLVTLVDSEECLSCGTSSVNRDTAGTAALAWVGSQLTGAETLVWKLTFQTVAGAAQDVTYQATATELYAGATALDPASGIVTVIYNPFTDIEGHWAKSDILKAYHAGLFVGTSSTTFTPEMNLDRAMFVTVLYRMAGAPAVDATETDFTDLKAGAYYVDAVAWATETGVTKGVSKTAFAPHKSISREELATMLYRYAKAMGEDVTGRSDLSGYQDAGRISGWAKEAMEWAIAEGILKGYPGGLLAAKTAATRAQSAVILSRYAGL